MFVTFGTLAVAADPVSAWSGSRWQLAVEETTPSPVELAAAENRSFRTRALQVEAVLDCPSAAWVGRQVEVTCRLEAVALRATPRSLAPSEVANPGNAIALADLSDRLQGAVVRITVTDDGRVVTADLPEVEASTRRESENREVLRRLVFDLVAGFHLRVPEGWEAGWVEKNSALIRAPTRPTTSGLSKVHHAVSVIDGRTVVQSEGKGTFTSPYEPWEFGYDGKITRRGTETGTTTTKPASIGQMPSMSASVANDGKKVSAGPTAAPTTPTDYLFEGTLSGVAVLDPDTGLPIERVWAMLGTPTASSLGNMQGTSVFYSGRVRRLAAGESVSLGLTEVVAPPGAEVDGIGVWQPLSVL